MESRTPPKFVPTLTEVAAQDAAPVVERNPALADDPSAKIATNLEATDEAAAAPASFGVDVLRRRREVDSSGDGQAYNTVDIADLPTESGWAQPADGHVLPMGYEPMRDADAEHHQIDTEQSTATLVTGAVGAVGMSVGHQAEGDSDLSTHSLDEDSEIAQDVHTGIDSDIDTDAKTAGLVASAAQAAQALEEAITRRVLKRVQETLDARLATAVLAVVEQQAALMQSSLQLQVDSTIRAAVADAVSQVLGAQSGVGENADEAETHKERGSTPSEKTT